MSFFDVRTIFVISAFFIFLYGFGMIAFARKMSSSFNGIYLFVAVNFLVATGVSLLLFRDYINVAWSIIVSNSLQILACNLNYHAHLQFLGYKKYPVLLSAVSLIGTVLLLIIFTYIVPNANSRVIVLSAFYCLQFSSIAHLVWRFHKQKNQPDYLPLMIISAVFALFFAVRFTFTMFSDEISPYKLKNDILHALLVVFMMLYIALLDFSIVLISSGKLVKKVAELAYKDTLTELYNRRGLDHALQNRPIFEKPFAVIVCDIDNFKLVNDRYGHNTGDIIIQAFAGLLKELTRTTDICTRLGGDEFLIVLPLTNEQEAVIVAEKIRLACEQFTFSKQPTLTFTCSFGVCVQHQNRSFEELVHDADQALYQAKNQGRSKVCVF
jgi:diguanylate cyclase (GGDEF)-like protein